MCYRLKSQPCHSYMDTTLSLRYQDARRTPRFVCGINTPAESQSDCKDHHRFLNGCNKLLKR